MIEKIRGINETALNKYIVIYKLCMHGLSNFFVLMYFILNAPMFKKKGKMFKFIIDGTI